MALKSSCLASTRNTTAVIKRAGRAGRWYVWLPVTLLVVAALLAIARHTHVPPEIFDDNAYVFLATDRLFEGHGPTSLPPKAPHQPWNWQADFTLLTQWPMGYPLLICLVRWLTGFATVDAAVLLNVVCSGVALVAWFAWIRRCAPGGISGWLLAGVAALGVFSVGQLVNPGSDTVLLAVTPLVLLLAASVFARERCASITDGRSESLRSSLVTGDGCPLAYGRGSVGSKRLGWIALLGVVSGFAFWIRYAAIFLPAGLGVFLLADALLIRRRRLIDAVVFGVASLTPIAVLILIHRSAGPVGEVQQQLNLGHRADLRLSLELLPTLWQRFTEQTLYAYRDESAWFFQLVVPAAGLAVPLAATAVFGDKYDYVGLARYYQPVRPFYWLLFVGPLLLIPLRIIRGGLCVMLVLFGSWFVNQDALRTWRRWTSRSYVTTPYGRRAVRFQPASSDLYEWLAANVDDKTLVVSNFHDDIALETRIPACPIPANGGELHTWIQRARTARNVDRMDALFVLDPDNDTRDYYLPYVADVVRRFGLSHRLDIPPAVRRYVYEVHGGGLADGSVGNSGRIDVGSSDGSS